MQQFSATQSLPDSVASDFRAAMAQVCTPVSVVTTVEDGQAHGTTVSAFASLSMTPPMMLVSLDGKSDLLAMVRRTHTLGLNILSAGQSGVASRFAVKGPDKLKGITWEHQNGAARLDDVSVWVSCEVATIVEGGDHHVILAHVVAVESTGNLPLTYHDRTFGTHN